jgi:hypothetical protein
MGRRGENWRLGRGQGVEGDGVRERQVRGGGAGMGKLDRLGGDVGRLTGGDRRGLEKGVKKTQVNQIKTNQN